MFKITWGVFDGIVVGLFFNWVIFRLFLDMRGSDPEWLLMFKIIIVLVFACFGFIISTTGLKKEKNGN